MGLAYGAADDASARSAKRIGVVIGPDGKVKELKMQSMGAFERIPSERPTAAGSH